MSSEDTQAETIHERIAKNLDTVLDNIMKDGRRVLTKDGEVVYIDPTAADINAARQRLAEIAKQQAPGEGLDEFAEDLLDDDDDEMPEIPAEDDAAS